MKKSIPIIVLFILILLVSCCDEKDGPTKPERNWELVFFDGFETLNTNIWEIVDFQSPGISYHTAKNLIVENGILKLKLSKVNDSIYGAEVRTIQNSFTYGKYEVRMKVPTGIGVVSSFFLYEDNGLSYKFNEEVDIEFRGRYNDSLWENYNNQIGSNERSDHGKSFKLIKPYSDGNFHTYSIEWDESSIKWFMDGEQIGNTASTKIPSKKMKIMINIWADTTVWTGVIDESILPLYVEYNWVKYSIKRNK